MSETFYSERCRVLFDLNGRLFLQVIILPFLLLLNLTPYIVDVPLSHIPHGNTCILVSYVILLLCVYVCVTILPQVVTLTPTHMS